MAITLNFEVRNLGQHGPKGIRIRLGKRPRITFHGRGPIAQALNSPPNRYLIGRALWQTICLPYHALRNLPQIKRLEIESSVKLAEKKIPATPVSEGRKYWVETLQNGTKIIFDYRPEETHVAACVRIDGAGVVSETEGEKGISHLLEHILIRASKQQIDNGHASPTDTVFDLFTPAEEFGVAFDRFLNSIFHPSLSEADLTAECRVVQEELALSLPFRKIMPRRAIWQDQFLGRGGLGNSTSIETLSITNLYHFHRRTYQGGNVRIFISGRFDPQMVMTTAHQLLPSGENAIPPPQPRTNSLAYVIQRTYRPIIFAICSRAFVPANQRERVLFKFLETLFDGGKFFSFLHDEVRLSGNDVYILGSQVLSIFDNHALEIFAAVEKEEDVPTIVKRILMLFDLLGSKNLSTKELDKYKAIAKKCIQYGQAIDPLQRGLTELSLGFDLSAPTMLETIDSLHPGEIRRMISRILGKQHLRFVIFSRSETILEHFREEEYPWKDAVVLFDANGNPVSPS
ncbi:M16 family metallopeptidase [Candidatus Margulisiibacteriota bacterium]